MQIKHKTIIALACILVLTGLFVISAAADGEETLGEPSIAIASGSGIVAGGTGMQAQPGTINLEVPAGVEIKQVLLYWSGASINGEPGDDQITVNGSDITGTEVGVGPGTKRYRSYRADITDLNIVAVGANSLTVENMTFNSENDGAGILVIYDNGFNSADIQLRDGLDIAYINRPEPGQTTIPQTFHFEPEDVERESEIVVMVGSVRVNELRPNAIHITVGDQFIELVNPLDSINGRQWDTLTIPVTIPAGASELTIQLLSIGDDVSTNTPASLTWVTATLSVPITPLSACADLSGLAPGTVIEGLGTVHPLLDIESSGNVKVVAEGVAPIAYRASNADRIINGNLGADNGFTDVWQQHDYTFTFAPDAEIGYFSLRMMDYGDWNPVFAKSHKVMMTAYDTDNNIVDEQVLAFTSSGALLPRMSSRGDLNFTGDASTAREGEPGNYVFAVQNDQMNIARVELRFDNNTVPGKSSDPLFALKDLCFGAPPPPPVCADFSAMVPGASVEGLGTVHPDFDIHTTGTAVVVAEDQAPIAYRASNVDKLVNGGLGSGGGFTDTAHTHDYVITFAPDVAAGEVSLKMLDFGDWNPGGAKMHQAALVAYDADNNVIDTHMLEFTNNGAAQPRRSSMGDLFIIADAVTAYDGEPGRMMYRVVSNGPAIARVELHFSSDLSSSLPSDPLFAISDLCYLPQD